MPRNASPEEFYRPLSPAELAERQRGLSMRSPRRVAGACRCRAHTRERTAPNRRESGHDKMSMNTHLQGRLRNTPLPTSHGLFCLFEAVVNSIQAIYERSPEATFGRITIEIVRIPQMDLQLEDGKSRRGSSLPVHIVGFKVADNGIGFNDPNMISFETLDGEYKAHLGCRGVGRLPWLKAFDRVIVDSHFTDHTGALKRRRFSFTASRGVDDIALQEGAPGIEPGTQVHLDGFIKQYRDASPKTAKTIAHSLVERRERSSGAGAWVPRPHQKWRNYNRIWTTDSQGRKDSGILLRRLRYYSNSRKALQDSRAKGYK